MSNLRSISLAKNIPFGCVVDAGKVTSNAAYRTIVDANCALLIFENSFKWKFLEPTRGSLQWGSLDKGIQYCKDHQIKFKLHCLFWHNSLPDWVNQLNAADLETAMKKRLTDVKNHFDPIKHMVYGIDVVNEAISDSGAIRSSIFSQKLGQNWIEKAFRWARDVFGTDYRLIYNDYNMENTPVKNNRILRLVKTLKQQGTVDEVGFQFHLSYQPTLYSTNNIAAMFKQYTDAGLDFSISEMDIRMKSGTQVSQTVLNNQGILVANVLAGALKHRPYLKSICCWGITDQFSWIQGDIPLPYDTHYSAKPFHAALLRALSTI
jgi:endo-1,4-beta-xylanase